jgi:hypothetical protein
MQKLLLEPKNVLQDTSLVLNSTSLSVNKEETLSQTNIRLDNNNSEENQVQQVGRSLQALVLVLSKGGKPLMPCSYAKSKRMVRTGKATVIKRFPFVIQLNFSCEERTQEIIFSLDTGYEKAGISARTEKKEILRIEVKLRIDVSDKVSERAMYRRNRRNKLWYREPRFNNRKGFKFAPSVQHKIDSHIRILEKISNYVPINKVYVEVGKFDIQKLINPAISGTDYQQGILYGYENIKAYMTAREHGKCQLCGKESSKGNGFRLHHIIPKPKGTDKPSNLSLLHEKCHEKLHKKNLHNLLTKNKQYKDATMTNIIRKEIVRRLRGLYPVEITYGYKTKVKRNELNLEKSHTNDAFVIGNGTNQERCKEVKWIQKQRNNRSIQQNRKGQKLSIRKQRYKIQTKDIIYIDNKPFISKGCQNLGTRVAYNNNGKNKTIRIENIDRWYNYGGFYAGI